MTDLKDQLVAQLETIPGVVHIPYPDRDDGFSAVDYGGKEIGHFHHFNEIDLRLGQKLIKQAGLKHYPDSNNHPGRSEHSVFIEIRFYSAADLDSIIQLVTERVGELTK